MSPAPVEPAAGGEMNDSQEIFYPSPWLHRYAVLVALSTLVLVFAGGLVKSKDAGLAVPDWPLSYGTLMPEGWFRAENVRAEHSHRMIAGAVAIMTVVLAVWVWRRDPRRYVRVTAVVSVVAVFVQALLGGLTVLFYLPAAISSSHAMLGQTFLCLNTAVALFTSRHWRRPIERIDGGPGARLPWLAYALVAAVFLQLGLGAAMRHTESGLAIPDFPLAYGQVLPPTNEVAVHNLNIDRDVAGLRPVTAGQILIHYAHRAWAIAVVALIVVIGVRVYRRHLAHATVLFPTVLLWILTTFQIMLGALTVWSLKNPHITTFHVANGAAVLALSVILSLEAARLIQPRHAAAPSAEPITEEDRDAATERSPARPSAEVVS